MSTQFNTYVIYGVLFAYDIFTEEGLKDLETFRDDYQTGKPRRSFTELTALVDGMNGEYVILGFVAQRGEDDAGEGLPVTKIPVLSEELEALLLEKIWEVAPIPEQQSAAAWYVLTHYR